jgi:hypothetical protein
MKTLEQTLTVPPDRRLHLDIEVPETWTGDSVRLVFLPVREVPTWMSNLSSKPEDEFIGFDFWQDRVRPGEDPFALLDAHGPFDGPSVDEFLAERHAENEREEALMGYDFWEDRVRPGDDPFAWHKYIGAFKDVGLSVDEFLEEKHAENEREEAKFDAMSRRTKEQQ